MKQVKELSIHDVLSYEVHSNWLAPYISFALGQDIVGWYIGQKVKRKYKRYLYSIEYRNSIISDKKATTI